MFALATTCDFVVSFTPERRTASEKDENEYEVDKKTGKIESMLLFVTNFIATIQAKQKECIDTYKPRRGMQVRQQNSTKEDFRNMFVIAMDNYFTLPKIIKKLHDLDIGVVRTARCKQGWPLKKSGNSRQCV